MRSLSLIVGTMVLGELGVFGFMETWSAGLQNLVCTVVWLPWFAVAMWCVGQDNAAERGRFELRMQRAGQRVSR